MAWLEKHQGCPPNDATCWGPVGEYWTLFGTELPFLLPHAALALLLGAALLGGALWTRHRHAWPIHWSWLVGAALLATPLLFLLLAALFPVHIVY